MAKSNRKHQPTTLTLRMLLAAMAAAVAAAVCYGLWYRAALAPVNPAATAPSLVHIPSGSSAQAVAELLQRRQLVRSRIATLLYLAASGQARKLKAGYYDLAPSMSTPEIVATISGGKVAHRKVVVVPGLRLEQVAQRVAKSGLVSADEFLAAARRADLYAGDVHFPLPRGRSVEGYMFPATYSLPVGISARGIVRRMLRAFEANFYDRYRKEIENSPLGLHQIVIIASMVEREAAVDDERPIIAGVLVNRLRLGWKLQCDATVQYALGHHKSRLLFRDLKVKSPYNTYLHKGLPPGPICSPGLPSLLAALRPAKHNYLFYVACGGGRHIFTPTYAEHLAAIERLRKMGVRK